jgi:hypothetical protein
MPFTGSGHLGSPASVTAGFKPALGDRDPYQTRAKLVIAPARADGVGGRRVA